MQLEAVGKLAEAGLIYKAILEEDETNVVSVIRTRGTIRLRMLPSRSSVDNTLTSMNSTCLGPPLARLEASGHVVARNGNALRGYHCPGQVPGYQLHRL